MLNAGIAFLIGASLLQLCDQLPSFSYSVLILPLILLSIRVKILRYITIIFLGFLYAHSLAYQQLSASLPTTLENKPIKVEGQITSIPTGGIQRQKFYFSIDTIIDNGREKLPLDKVRLSWYQPHIPLVVGQRWQLSVKLKRPHGAFNQGGFNYETWLWVNGVAATGSVLKGKTAQLIGSEGHALNKIRQYYYQNLSALLEKTDNKALFMALAMAYKADLTEQQRTLFQQTGTAHLLAISGLHIGLASAFFWVLGAAIWRLLAPVMHNKIQVVPKPLVAALFALSGATFYAILAGFSIPTTRALIVIFFALSASVFRRYVSWQQTLGAALLCIVLLQPFSILSMSFCLSFLAVFMIAYVSQGRKIFSGNYKAKLRGFTVIQFALSLMMVPLLLFYFGQTALLGAAANFVAIPIASFVVVPAVLLLLLLLPFHTMPLLGSLIDIYVVIVDAIFTGFIKLISLFNYLPFASTYLYQPSLLWLSIALLALLILFLPKAVPYRYMAIIVVLPLFFPYKKIVSSNEFEVNVLDVGQGLAVLVSTQNHHLLYDAGVAYPEGFDSGSDIILPVLRKRGINKLDTLIVSHADLDHRGGVPAIAAQMSVGKIKTNVPESILFNGDDSHTLSFESCRRGQNWVWDGVKFEILHPPEYWFTKDNDASCVLRISNANMRIIIPGDIEWLGEYELVDVIEKQAMDIESDILLAPHHGSLTSSSAAFLQEVDAEYVIYSAGYLNRFNLPNKTIQQRYQDYDTKPLNTAISGQITINSQTWSDQDAILLNRQQNRRYWYWQQNTR